ncbi:carboxypeptidase regulatory-like domain-containing protein [Rhodococcus sp. NPDC003382]|uniref:carboxypeptidase regulatory-like domain-containing protein n=1 Tax=unclassified Rhodococcus (in: high G+C Gram-positive bacteria) TaxID=192944 RepID=UPI0018CE3597|nr:MULTISPECIES: carboxypeptidase regulatory-like domain-containing protein [unclassified Rhodococcus (in: high G+C Gram-positive bacteria)]MBH0122941.1 carboxypeptidase regulatory-like domain-containing protein [Rhodococcus sp. CX]MCK8670912.1 carboxypeptidase-like regulatory domain-containing protein [Rhodococcus sp. HM1]
MIRGIVRCGNTPVPFARIVVVTGPGPMPEIAILSGPDGSFTVGTPYPGRYLLAVHADEYRPARLEVTLPEASSTAEVVAALETLPT